MEWHDGQVKQKPGGSNVLGYVKFMFLNSYNIYLHDSTSRSFFNKDFTFILIFHLAYFYVIQNLKLAAFFFY